jgi:serine/threonine protein kinase
MGENHDVLGLGGTTLKGTFVIERAVARGGFGIVYRGRHLSLQKDIAIKIFCPIDVSEPHLEREAISHFLQEIKILATLEHPAIVRPYDCGTLNLPERGDVPWMALEWIEGRTLAELLRTQQRRTWSPREALDLLRPVIQALAEAHAHGIAHRDVAPNNIIVHESAHGTRVRLIDFGIAAIRPSYADALPFDAPTQSPLIAHSHRYPAPEQILEQRTGTWTDVHAIGLIIYQLLTGYLPYPNSARDPEHGACALRRPTPGLVGVDVGAWEHVLSRAVAINPGDRYTNAGELLDALERTLDAAVPHDEFEVAMPENWRVVDVAPADVPLLLNTPTHAVIIHVVAPKAEDLRQGFEVPLTVDLGCKLVIQRYADVSLALSVVGHPGERPGLYSNPAGHGSRLMRAMLDADGEKAVYCGLRTAGLREVVCHVVQSAAARQLAIDVGRLNLTVCFSAPVREFIILQVDEPQLSRVHLACIGVH